MSAAGNITKRGASSWRLKFEGPRDPETGRRNIQYCTVRGSKAAAKIKLAEMIAAVGGNAYIEPTKLSVAEHVRNRVDQWETGGDISCLSAQTYRRSVETYIAPLLGSRPLQKLTTTDIEAWHGKLLARISARTAEGVHRVLSHALKDAVRHGLVPRNVAAIQGPPKVDAPEVQAVQSDRIDD